MRSPGQQNPSSERDSLLQARLRQHVDMLAGVIGPRHVHRPGTTEATTAYIEKQIAEIGRVPRRERFDAGPMEVANLIVECTGTKRPDEVIILGAHYDTDPATPGADDNASAVAMLIEVVRMLRDVEFKRTVRFIAFACEEVPHFYTDTMGSQVHAQGCRARGECIVGMICLEMVGYFTDAANSQGVPPGIPKVVRWLFPKRGNFLASVGNMKSIPLVIGFRSGFKRASRLPLFSIALPERIREIRLSDNGPFWDAGYPALMITDTSFLRNPHYHLPSDTIETLDFERLAQGTLGVAGAIKHLGHGRTMM